MQNAVVTTDTGTYELNHDTRHIKIDGVWEPYISHAAPGIGYPLTVRLRDRELVTAPIRSVEFVDAPGNGEGDGSTGHTTSHGLPIEGA